MLSPAGSASMLLISWSPSVGHSRGEVGIGSGITEVQLGVAFVAEVFEPNARHVILLVSCVCWIFRIFNSWPAVIRKIEGFCQIRRTGLNGFSRSYSQTMNWVQANHLIRQPLGT